MGVTDNDEQAASEMTAAKPKERQFQVIFFLDESTLFHENNSIGCFCQTRPILLFQEINQIIKLLGIMT